MMCYPSSGYIKFKEVNIPWGPGNGCERRVPDNPNPIKNKDAGNILGINSATLLNLVKLKSDDQNTVNKIEEEHNNIVKLLEDYNDVFKGNGKLKNHEAKLRKLKTDLPENETSILPSTEIN